MNTSLENLTHKMQRAALGKIVDVALSRAEQDHEKTMCQLVDVAKQFYGSGFGDETYENAKKVLTDPDSKKAILPRRRTSSQKGSSMRVELV